MPDEQYKVFRSGGVLTIEFTLDNPIRAQHNERGFVNALRNGDLHRIIQHNIDYDEPFFQNNLADVISLFPELPVSAFRYGLRPGYYVFDADTNEFNEWELFTQVRNLLTSHRFSIKEFHISEAHVNVVFYRG